MNDHLMQTIHCAALRYDLASSYRSENNILYIRNSITLCRCISLFLAQGFITHCLHFFKNRNSSNLSPSKNMNDNKPFNESKPQMFSLHCFMATCSRGSEREAQVWRWCHCMGRSGAGREVVVSLTPVSRKTWLPRMNDCCSHIKREDCTRHWEKSLVSEEKGEVSASSNLKHAYTESTNTLSSMQII